MGRLPFATTFARDAENVHPLAKDHADRKPERSELPRIARFRWKDIDFATNGFDKSCLVGQSVHGQMYSAKLDNGGMVTVKKAWPGDRYWDGQLGFENERQILSRCRGRYLMNLVGISEDTPERILLLDFASNGNLHDALHLREDRPLSWSVRLQLAFTTAVALRGLHSASTPIVHRDLRSSNVWINHDWRAMLGGFEFSFRPSVREATVKRPPAKAMACFDPDYQATKHLCAKTDVFCFGVLLLEIISGRKATDVKNSPPYVVDWAIPLIYKDKALCLCDPKVRPPYRNEKVVVDTARIACRCLNRESARRPAMAEVAQELEILSLKVPIPRHGIRYERGVKRAGNKDGAKTSET